MDLEPVFCAGGNRFRQADVPNWLTTKRPVRMFNNNTNRHEKILYLFAATAFV